MARPQRRFPSKRAAEQILSRLGPKTASLVRGYTSKHASTSIERKTQKALELLGVKFQKERWVGNYRVDFLIGAVVVECDGCYYHACAECGYNSRYVWKRAADAKRDKFMRSRGFFVLRLPEHLIKSIHVKDLAAWIRPFLDPATRAA